MTVTRPGGLPASPLEDPDRPRRPRRRVPGPAKVAGVVLAVLVVAVVNSTATKRQERAALAAADRVDAALLAAPGEAHDHEFEVMLLVHNSAGTPITVRAGRRVEPPAYDAKPFEDRVVGAGATEELAVPFTPRCPTPATQPTQPLALVVPIAPASGRVREVRTDLDPEMMWDLSRRACGYLEAEEAAQPAVSGVTSSRYAVRFRMKLANTSDRSFVLEDLTSPALALSVLGGVPLAVAPHSDVDLAVAVALPACSRLPPSARRGRGVAPPFGSITLVLRDDAGAQRSKVYVPQVDLSTALLALRLRICPASGQPTEASTSPVRPQALGDSGCPGTDATRSPGVDHDNGAAERCP